MSQVTKDMLDAVVAETFGAMAFADVMPTPEVVMPTSMVVARIGIDVPWKGALWVAAEADMVEELARSAWGFAADESQTQRKAFLDEMLNVVAGALAASVSPDGEVAIGFAESADPSEWPDDWLITYDIEGHPMTFALVGLQAA
ncbi:MAG: hypothetical protein KC621_25995 [Myxococcales bacterium]|nr:hypothetical protein [Myxococcales bacterium]